MTTPARSLVVVAGGRARRLGRDKPLVEIGGRAILLRILDATSHIADVVLAVRQVPPFARVLAAEGWGRGAERAAHPAGSAALRHPHGRDLVVVPDPVSGLGPLAGLASGLAAARNPICVVLAGDLPFVTAELVDGLSDRLARGPEYDAVVPHARGRAQPLCAAYRQEVRDPAARLLAEGSEVNGPSPSMMGLLARLRVRYVGADDLPGVGDLDAATRGVDSPDDLAWADQRCT